MGPADLIGVVLEQVRQMVQTTVIYLTDFTPIAIVESIIQIGTPVVHLETLDLSDIILHIHILTELAVLK